MAQHNPLLQFPQRFLRTSLEFNSMVRLTCKACSRTVAYSKDPCALDIAEKVHQCSRRRNTMRIFVVDADYSAAQATAGLLRRSGFEVFTFDDVLMAAQYAFKNTPEIVVTQYAMPNLNGLVLAAWLKVNYPACKVVVISEDAAKVAEEAPSGLSITLVKKPAAPEVLATVIESICREGEGPLLARAR